MKKTIMVETDDGERRSSWREYHGNVAVLKNVCGSTMCKYECEYGCENVDKKSDPGEEKDRSISSSRGQFFKSLMCRDRRYDESRALL